MNRSELLTGAMALKAPSSEVTKEFEGKSARLAEELNRILGERPDVNRLVGPDNLEMMFDNHRNHARFMTSVFYAYDPKVLVDTVIWVFRAYLSHGFSLAYWPAQLDTWVELFKQELSDQAYEEIYPFYHWLIINQATFVTLARQSSTTADEKPQH